MNDNEHNYQDQNIGKISVSEDESSVRFSYAPGNSCLGGVALLWLIAWTNGIVNVFFGLTDDSDVYNFFILSVMISIELFMLGVVVWNLFGRIYMRIDYRRIETGFQMVFPLKWTSFKTYHVSSAWIIEDRHEEDCLKDRFVICIQSASKKLFFGKHLADYELLGALYFMKSKLKKFGLSCRINAKQFAENRTLGMHTC